MTAGTILGLITAYIVIAVLLLSLNLTSRWKWGVKAVAIVVTASFFVGAYIFTYRLLGWPTNTELPGHFQVLWATVEEPNKFTGEEGGIYIWLDTLDEYNIPLGIPRAHELPYTDRLAEALLEVQEKIQEGVDVSGMAERFYEETGDEEGMENTEGRDEESSGRYDVDVFPDEHQVIEFGDMPPPVLPDKDVI